MGHSMLGERGRWVGTEKKVVTNSRIKYRPAPYLLIRIVYKLIKCQLLPKSTIWFVCFRPLMTFNRPHYCTHLHCFCCWHDSHNFWHRGSVYEGRQIPHLPSQKLFRDVCERNTAWWSGREAALKWDCEQIQESSEFSKRKYGSFSIDKTTWEFEPIYYTRNL